MAVFPDKPYIVLASYPRSGNTFLRNILHDVFGVFSWNNTKMYGRRMDEYRELDKLQKTDAIDADDLKRHNTLEQQLKQYVLKTHEMPSSILPDCDENAKLIYLVRDGRDALVSMAHHRKDIVEPGTDFLANLEESIMAPLGSYFGGWGNNVTEWTKIAHLVIYFENLIREPEKEIHRLKAVLDLPDPKLDNIPTFDSQRSGESHFGRKKRQSMTEKEKAAFSEKFFRSGKIGGWKEDMPKELHRKFWKKYGDVMLTMGYQKDGSLNIK
jgi:hypothetical protein